VGGVGSPIGALGDSVEVFIRREDAERFVEKVRGDDLELAACLRIEERELDAGGLEDKAPLRCQGVGSSRRPSDRKEARWLR
jgi:hypothetical protein